MVKLNGYKSAIICEGVKIGIADCVPGNRPGCPTCKHAMRAKVRASPNVSDEEAKSPVSNTSRHLNGAEDLYTMDI
jgi:hypothetical protein